MTVESEMKERWAAIDKGVQRIVDARILPVETDQGQITEASLRNELSTLRNDRYTIAVCGTVKSGKSTLLNALFFGDEVLPAFDTPMTAKLTFIEHTDARPYFEVSFYSPENWRQIKDNLSESDREQLASRLQLCASRGAFEQKWIGHAPVKGTDIRNELPLYVSDPASGMGRFTPFVASVTIYINHPALKTLRIVDTPGLNDANELNSRETAQWVRNAHAVIYVLECRGASEADVDFFMNYFPSDAAKSRIFVQNKIDTERESYRSALMAIRQYGREPRYRDRGLFGPDETICSYSGLGVLLRCKRDQGVNLSEDDLWYLQNSFPDDFECDPDRLDEQLSRKLYAGEGSVRLGKAAGRLLQIYDLALLRLEERLADVKNQIPDCDKTCAQLSKEIEGYKSYRRKIKDAAFTSEQSYDELLVRDKQKISDAFNLMITKSLDDARTALSAVRSKEAWMHTAMTRFRIIKQRGLLEVQGVATRVVGEFRASLKRTIDDLMAASAEAGIIDEPVIPKLEIILKDNRIDQAISELEAGSEELDDLVPGKLKRFVTFTSRDTVVSDIVSFLDNRAREKFAVCESVLMDKLEGLFKDNVNAVMNAFLAHCDARQKNLEAAQDGMQKAESRKKELLLAEKKTQADLKALETSRVEVKHLVKGSL